MYRFVKFSLYLLLPNHVGYRMIRYEAIISASINNATRSSIGSCGNCNRFSNSHRVSLQIDPYKHSQRQAQLAIGGFSGVCGLG
jgi:hypothetical protein